MVARAGGVSCRRLQHRSPALREGPRSRRGPGLRRTCTGAPGNLGGLVVFINTREGRPADQGPGPATGSRRERSKSHEPDENRGTKETKCFESGTDDEKSELPIVPMKRGNRPMGPRGGKGKLMEPGSGSLKGKTSRPQTLDAVSTKLQRIAELARNAPVLAFRSLAHHIDAELLRVAYRRTRKDGAVGVDGVTAAAYEQHLERNLQSLLARFKAGTYTAPPVRRVEIPKGNGATRPIGIPTFEDKVLQRAVAMVLNAVYEQDFLDCSFGFRPRRSAHDALDAVWNGVMKMGGGWVLEVDIRHFFDSVDHRQLRVILDRRVRDGVLRRSIDKWLKAGVQQHGSLWFPEEGTPQGGVISPLLANVYLHDVLDVWFEKEVRPRLAGEAVLVRYADDVVIAFELQRDASRVMEVLPKRFAKYNLTLHPEKTRLLDFRKPRHREARETFELLGFTHFWGTSRKGNAVVQRRTSSSRFSRALRRVVTWCRNNRHAPVREQHKQLVRKLNGHYQYFGITGNARALSSFSRGVRAAWRKWLGRRSSSAQRTWSAFVNVLRRYPLPLPTIVHSVFRRAANTTA